MINVKSTIISQYSSSAKITALVELMNYRIDPRSSVEQFVKDVWDIRYCGTWGLNNWGRILNMPRAITVPQGTDEDFFGFKSENAPQSWKPFGQAVFNVPFVRTGTYYLNNEQYRMVLMFKAAVNISDGTIPSINRLLQWYFSLRGRPYVLRVNRFNKRGFRLRYMFDFYLQDWEKSLLRIEGVLPTPMGVGYALYEYKRNHTFGFCVRGVATQPYAPFSQAPFTRGVANV